MSRTPGSSVASPAPAGSGSGFALDVVGVGALNLDYVAGDPGPPRGRPFTRRLAELLGRRPGAAGGPLEWGVEHQVDSVTMHAVIDAVSPARPDAVLGGSAFNAIHAIAMTKAGLRLGYVGVAGRVPVTGLSVIQRLDTLGIDSRYVRQDAERLCGICFSYSEDGDRTMLTHAGANDQMADYIEQEFDNLVRYLVSARIIHVTPILDDRTPGALLALLREVRRTGRGNVVSFDPGHVWSSSLTPEIEGIVALSDCLLLNNREFGDVGGRSPGESDEAVAERVLDRIDSPDGVVIVKRAAGVWSHRREGGRTHSEFYAQAPLPDEEIKDATGAGDVFAAGLLIALASRRPQVGVGALLGMRLARHKLRYVGDAGHAQFAGVTRDFIRALDAERGGAGQPTGVFIPPGDPSRWRTRPPPGRSRR